MKRKKRRFPKYSALDTLTDQMPSRSISKLQFNQSDISAYLDAMVEEEFKEFESDYKTGT